MAKDKIIDILSLKDFLCILNDATVQVIHIFKSFKLKIGACFFATNTARAVHDHFFIFMPFQVIDHQRQFLAEGIRIGAKRAVKSPHFAFIMIAHIHHNGIRIFDGFIEFYRVKVFSGVGRVKIRIVNSIGHNFIAHFNDQFVK